MLYVLFSQILFFFIDALHECLCSQIGSWFHFRTVHEIYVWNKNQESENANTSMKRRSREETKQYLYRRFLLCNVLCGDTISFYMNSVLFFLNSVLRTLFSHSTICTVCLCVCMYGYTLSSSNLTLISCEFNDLFCSARMKRVTLPFVLNTQ